MKDIQSKDPNVKIHRNEGPTRLGHTILYDTLLVLLLMLLLLQFGLFLWSVVDIKV